VITNAVNQNFSSVTLGVLNAVKMYSFKMEILICIQVYNNNRLVLYEDS
jgi:hypothetical protein